MLTPDLIDAIRQHTGVSAIDAMHALAVAEGDVQRAIGDLNNHARSGNRAITASTRESAQRIAAALVDAGLWFECELTAQAHWRFSVALGAYSKLLAVSHEAANGEAAAA
jgi:hypothetical protein